MVAESTKAAGGPAPAPDMGWIPAGTFMMGYDSHYPEEAPAHQVSVDGFWIMQGKTDQPVVQLAWADVDAFARWAGKQLPSEAESEMACRGGLDGATYAWGEELTPGSQWMANTWQGEFPVHNTRADGHAGTAPVARISPTTTACTT